MATPRTAATEADRRVLFVCLQNATRSPMAAALARDRAGLAARSAGVYAAEHVDPFAVRAMAELGLDIGDHRAASVAELEAAGDHLQAYTAVIALTPAAAEALEPILGHACELWPTEDPTAVDSSDDARLEAYRRIRDGLATRIAARFSGEEAVDAASARRESRD